MGPSPLVRSYNTDAPVTEQKILVALNNAVLFYQSLLCFICSFHSVTPIKLYIIRCVVVGHMTPSFVWCCEKHFV